MEINVFVDGNEMISLNGYYIDASDNISEKVENLLNLEDLLKDKLLVKDYDNISSLLYALINIKDGISDDVKSEQEFIQLNKLLHENKSQLDDFLSKWYDESTDSYKYILDLTDSEDYNEPYEFYYDGTLRGIEVISEKNNNTYLVNYEKGTNAELDEFTQMYIEKDKYQELISDLESLLQQ